MFLNTCSHVIHVTELYSLVSVLIQNALRDHLRESVLIHSKTFVKWPLSKRPKIGIQDNYRLMQVKSFAECSCNTFDLY